MAIDLNRRTDYACRIVRAAYRANGQLVSVSKVAEAESIPYAFARSIQHDLVRSGILRAERGAKGGLMLNCDTSKVTVLDLIESLQGPHGMSPCTIDEDYCSKAGECEYHEVWLKAEELVRNYFAGITIDDLFSGKAGA